MIQRNDARGFCLRGYCRIFHWSRIATYDTCDTQKKYAARGIGLILQTGLGTMVTDANGVRGPDLHKRCGLWSIHRNFPHPKSGKGHRRR